MILLHICCYCVIIIFNISILPQKDVCNGTVFFSLKGVNSSSKSKTDYQERSQSMSCESYPLCLGEPLVYHCVRLEEELVEVCAPRNQITGLSKYDQIVSFFFLFKYH